MRMNNRETNINAVIQTLFAESGLSDYMIAKNTGLPYNQVRRWGTGKTKPTIEMLEKLLELFGYDLVIQKKPIGLAEEARKAKDAGISYGELQRRRFYETKR